MNLQAFLYRWVQERIQHFQHCSLKLKLFRKLSKEKIFSVLPSPTQFVSGQRALTPDIQQIVVLKFWGFFSICGGGRDIMCCRKNNFALAYGSHPTWPFLACKAPEDRDDKRNIRVRPNLLDIPGCQKGSQVLLLGVQTFATDIPQQ